MSAPPHDARALLIGHFQAAPPPSCKYLRNLCNVSTELLLDSPRRQTKRKSDDDKNGLADEGQRMPD